MSDQEQLTTAVTAVASHGLAGSCVPTVERALTGREWDRLMAAVTAERLPGHLVAAIAFGALPATPSQLDEAVQMHTRTLSHTLRLERLLLHATSWLHEAGIEHRVVKGAALAHTVYADPSLRAYDDVDLIVPHGAAERAVAVLRSRGLSRSATARWRAFVASASPGEVLRSNDGLEVDLQDAHAMFGGTVEPGRLFGEVTGFRLAARTLPTLAPEHLLLHLCYEAAAGRGPRLSALRDVAEVILRAGVQIDRVLVAASSSAWGPAAVAQTIRWTWERFALADIVPLSAWAARYGPDRDERRALAELRTRRNGDSPSPALRAVRGLLGRLPFLRSWGDVPETGPIAPHMEGRRR